VGVGAAETTMARQQSRMKTRLSMLSIVALALRAER
jgi:hypothetical protein